MKRKKRWSFILLMCCMPIMLMCVTLFIKERICISNIIIFYLNHTCLFQPCPYVTANHLYMYILFFVCLFVCYSCVAPTFSFEWNKEVLDLTIALCTDSCETVSRLPNPDECCLALLFSQVRTKTKQKKIKILRNRFILPRDLFSKIGHLKIKTMTATTTAATTTVFFFLVQVFPQSLPKFSIVLFLVCIC